MRYTEIRKRFCSAAELAGVPVHEADLEIQYLSSPHTPPSALPKGKCAVYVFMLGDRCLKVGKAGPKSAARFCNQHYGVNRAPSTLAKSIIKSGLGAPEVTLTANNVSSWLCNNTARIHFLLPASYGPPVLAFLEAFVLCCLHPEFEGFASQRDTQQFAQPAAKKRAATGSRLLAKHLVTLNSNDDNA